MYVFRPVLQGSADATFTCWDTLWLLHLPCMAVVEDCWGPLRDALHARNRARNHTHQDDVINVT